MTFTYQNVFLAGAVTVAGPNEAKGRFKKFYTKINEDYYIDAKTWEQSEINQIKQAVKLMRDKVKIKPDLFIGGDLSNQIAATSYSATTFDLPFLGLYNACATSVEGLIIASNMIEGGLINNAMISASSHYAACEKQFRYPVEYGFSKPQRATITTTGCGVALLTNKKEEIVIKTATIGKPVDSKIKDAHNMGGVMAIAAYNTIKTHLENTKEKYDLIITGDLGIYGLNMIRELLPDESITDAGSEIFEMNAGGSGAACLPLVAYSYYLKQLRSRNLKKILLVATGALLSPTMVNQKLPIPSIAHAISLEVTE